MIRSALHCFIKDKGSERAKAERHLKTALKYMKKDSDLHKSLWDWADELNQLGNEGAHPDDTTTSRMPRPKHSPTSSASSSSWSTRWGRSCSGSGRRTNRPSRPNKADSADYGSGNGRRAGRLGLDEHPAAQSSGR